MNYYKPPCNSNYTKLKPTYVIRKTDTPSLESIKFFCSSFESELKPEKLLDNLSLYRLDGC